MNLQEIREATDRVRGTATATEPPVLTKRDFVLLPEATAACYTVGKAGPTIEVGEEIMNTPEGLVGKTVLVVRTPGGAWRVLAGHSVPAAEDAGADGGRIVTASAGARLHGAWPRKSLLDEDLLGELTAVALAVAERSGATRSALGNANMTLTGKEVAAALMDAVALSQRGSLNFILPTTSPEKTREFVRRLQRQLDMQGQLRVLMKAPESAVVREEGGGGGANDSSSITKVTNFDDKKVATLLGTRGEVKDGVSPGNQLKVVRTASVPASIAAEHWASGALVVAAKCKGIKLHVGSVVALLDGKADSPEKTQALLIKALHAECVSLERVPQMIDDLVLCVSESGLTIIAPVVGVADRVRLQLQMFESTNGNPEEHVRLVALSLMDHIKAVRAAAAQDKMVDHVADSVELCRAVGAYERAHGVGAEYVARQAALAAEEERAAKAARIGGGGGKGAWGAWGAGGGGDWDAGWSGIDGHYSRGSGGGGGGWGALDGGAHAQGMGTGQKGGKGKGKGGGPSGPCFHLLRSGQCGHMRDFGFCNFAHKSMSGKKLCPGHFLNGGCHADGACALAHSVAE